MIRIIYGCSECRLRTYRTRRGVAAHIVRKHDGAAVATETHVPLIDIRIEDHGSVVLLRPTSAEGGAWLDEHVDNDAPCLGIAVAVEPRYVADIVAGARADGLVVA